MRFVLSLVVLVCVSGCSMQFEAGKSKDASGDFLSAITQLDKNDQLFKKAIASIDERLKKLEPKPK